MLSAGTNVEWLRDDLGILETSAQSHDVASQCESTDGVVYVPALLGLGTPRWDYGARGTLLGLTRGAGRPQIVRAVLEGVAQRGADLVDAAEADGAPPVAALRIDGGMSRNPTFVQALADATQRPVEVSPDGRGHDPRRRLRRRPGPRHLVVARRHRGHVVPDRRRRSRRAARPRPLGHRGRPRRPSGSPSCPGSTSDGPGRPGFWLPGVERP